MEIKSSTSVLTPSQIKQAPAQKVEAETIKNNTVNTVTISSEAQALLDEVTPNRGGGAVVGKT